MHGTVVITGAGSGIGRCLCGYFAAKGWRVCATDISEERARETAQLVAGEGGKALAVQVDVRRTGDVQAMLRTCGERFGRIDALVNNAGTTDRKLRTIIEVPYEVVQDIVSTNLLGAFICLKEFASMQRRDGGGNIVNVTSLLAQRGHARAGTAAYGISKAAVEALNEYAAVELREKGINVNAVYPGVMVNTGFFEHLPEDEREKLEKPSVLNELVYLLCCLSPGELTGGSFNYQSWKQHPGLISLYRTYLGGTGHEGAV